MPLEPLLPDDIPRALEIIGQHDEDDLEWAQESYGQCLDGQYVLRHEGAVVGVTGFRIDASIAWISWTYLDENVRGQGLGHVMLGELLEAMSALPIRKAFVSTSDYSEDGVQLYGAAIKLYQDLGFRQEVYHRDYYEEGEGMIIFGRPFGGAPSEQAETPAGMVLKGFEQVDETEDSYFIDWEPSDKPILFAPRDLFELYLSAMKAGGRNVYISFPSDVMPRLQDHLQKCSLVEEGRLEDYHGPGVAEVRLRFVVPV